MKIVNQNFRFQLHSRWSYEELAKKEYIQNYRGRPTMIKYKRHGSTIMVFTSLKARIMGNPDNHWQTVEEFCKLSESSISGYNCQSCTVIHRVPFQIPLDKLPSCFRFEPEIFFAAYRIIENVHVNVFHTGKINITGTKSLEEAQTVYDSFIYPYLLNSSIS